MKKMAIMILVVICSVVIVASFFAPWARAKVAVTKVAAGMTTAASNELGNTPFAGKIINELNTATKAISSLGDIEIKTQVRGCDIPTLINKKSSRIALSLAQILFKDAKDLDKKSLLVYLLPIFAIVCIVLAVLGLKNKLFVVGMMIIGGVISIAGLYNLMTMNLTGLPVEITIMSGLWQTIYGNLLIFVLSIVWLVIDRK